MAVLNVAVVGASGYVGAELVSILLHHSEVRIAVLAGDSSAGRALSDIYQSIQVDSSLPNIVHLDSADFSGCDVVFLCLPHGKSSHFVNKIPAGVRIIDLGADFRLRDVAVYESIYGKHAAHGLIESFVFGLSECYRPQLDGAGFISCPGCYTTAALLPLIPLMKNSVIDGSSIIIDAKSGISGAGRTLSEKSLFCEGYDTFRAYSVEVAHRHLLEVEQEVKLGSESGKEISVQLTTQLVPMNRGIMCTIYLPCASGDAMDVLSAQYSSSKFVHLNNAKSLDVRSVIRTNLCYIGVFPSKNGTLIVSIIDNLLKGAAGQAVQNFNISFGFGEDLCLLKSNVRCM